MTNHEYRKHPAISNSDLNLAAVSVLHYANRAKFRRESDAFELGSFIHKMVLEPDQVHDEYIPEVFEGSELNKNSKRYKEAKAEFEAAARGKIIISQKDWTTAERIKESVHLIAGGLLKNGVAERSYFAKDEFGFDRKCRPDYYLEDAALVIDLKTTKSCSPYDFQKAIYDYSYHRQAAWYIDTLRLAGKKAERFIIIAVEKTAPYMIRVYQLDDEAIETGRETYITLLEKIKRYQTTGKAEVIEPISLPQWAFKESEEA